LFYFCANTSSRINRSTVRAEPEATSALVVRVVVAALLLIVVLIVVAAAAGATVVTESFLARVAPFEVPSDLEIIFNRISEIYDSTVDKKTKQHLS